MIYSVERTQAFSLNWARLEFWFQHWPYDSKLSSLSPTVEEIRPPSLPHGPGKYQYSNVEFSGSESDGLSLSSSLATYLAWNLGLSLRFLIFKREKNDKRIYWLGLFWRLNKLSKVLKAQCLAQKSSKRLFISISYRPNDNSISNPPRNDL